VLRSDKKQDWVFQQKDFLPEGSRVGIVGGIAEGRQGFFLSSEDIPGLRFLRKGDRFDLLASTKREDSAITSEYGLLMGGVKVLAGKPIPLNGVRILAQDAEVIALTTDSFMTTQGGLKLNETALQQNRSRASNQKEHVAIAIAPEESIPLTQALADGVAIHMVTRSGQEPIDHNEQELLMGWVSVTSNTKQIRPFQAIKASDLTEADSGELRQYFFDPEKLNPEWIQDPKQLIGRVVNREIEPGYLFTDEDFLSPGSLIEAVEAYEQIPAEILIGGDESPLAGRVASRDIEAGEVVQEDDLFPEGTLPGISAAIPAGRLAIFLQTNQIEGSGNLVRGDVFDLLCLRRIADDSELDGIEVTPALLHRLQGESINQVLAEHAIVIKQQADEVIVALRPEEILNVTKALGASEKFYCLRRPVVFKGHEDHAVTDTDHSFVQMVSDSNPLDEIQFTETIIAGQRVLRAYLDPALSDLSAEGSK
ncbi:MAG: hypothetical protein L7U72_03575, partial [Rubripirellula sp.]|nr:hypothetical protein [Rubripirellula sp.]